MKVATLMIVVLALTSIHFEVSSKYILVKTEDDVPFPILRSNFPTLRKNQCKKAGDPCNPRLPNNGGCGKYCKCKAPDATLAQIGYCFQTA